MMSYTSQKKNKQDSDTEHLWSGNSGKKKQKIEDRNVVSLLYINVYIVYDLLQPFTSKPSAPND